VPVEEVAARVPDLGAFQRPAGGVEDVPVLHFGGQPASCGAVIVHICRAGTSRDCPLRSSWVQWYMSARIGECAAGSDDAAGPDQPRGQHGDTGGAAPPRRSRYGRRCPRSADPGRSPSRRRTWAAGTIRSGRPVASSVRRGHGWPSSEARLWARPLRPNTPSCSPRLSPRRPLKSARPRHPTWLGSAQGTGTADPGRAGPYRRADRRPAVITVRTVGCHLDRIRDKTGCRRRAGLTRLALAAGLV
jgi:hypothetical protein